MSYLIDTDVVIDHLENVPAAIDLIERLSPNGIAISVICYMEVYQGLLRSQDRAGIDEGFLAFLIEAPIIPFSTAVARRCATIREHLRVQGKRVRPRALDLMNAATAIEHNLTLVTRNVNDYGDIPDLRMYHEVLGT